jgi:ankyrin repeat protein
MVLAIADYLKVSETEDLRQIHKSISPVLLNSIAGSNNLDLFVKMHKEGADLDAVDYMGRSVVHVLASSGSAEMAKYLIK